MDRVVRVCVCVCVCVCVYVCREIQRLDIKYPVVFYGSETVMAVAYDVPIPGYPCLSFTCPPQHLLSAGASSQFPLISRGEGLTGRRLPHPPTWPPYKWTQLRHSQHQLAAPVVGDA